MKKEDVEQAAQQYAEGPECTWVGTTALEIAFLAGAKWQRDQMMKVGAEGKVVKDINNKLAVTAKINLDGFKFGDKVRIIIVKE